VVVIGRTTWFDEIAGYEVNEQQWKSTPVSFAIQDDSV